MRKAKLDDWREKHRIVEAELTANERMVEKLQFSLRDAVSTATENARQRDALRVALKEAIQLLDDCEIAHPLRWENELSDRGGADGRH